jgi:hypothetical protein
MKISSKLDATIRDYAHEGQDGEAWYEDSHHLIIEAADVLNVPRIDLFAALAVYSPRVPVRRSIGQAVNALLTSGGGGMKQRDTAMSQYFAYGERAISGPKVTPFFRNLVDPLEAGIGKGAVTVDVWISRAYGVDFNKIKVGERRAIQDHIRSIANEVGGIPNRIQAGIWRGFRLASGVDDYAPLDVLTELQKEGALIC